MTGTRHVFPPPLTNNSLRPAPRTPISFWGTRPAWFSLFPPPTALFTRIFPPKPQTNPQPQNPPRAKITPAPVVEKITWDTRAVLIDTVRAGQGSAQTVRITVISRPTSVVERGNTVILTLTHNSPLPPMPKGVPVPPVMPTTTYIVLCGREAVAGGGSGDEGSGRRADHRGSADVGCRAAGDCRLHDKDCVEAEAACHASISIGGGADRADATRREHSDVERIVSHRRTVTNLTYVLTAAEMLGRPRGGEYVYRICRYDRVVRLPGRHLQTFPPMLV